jgi:hypothetical protein
MVDVVNELRQAVYDAMAGYAPLTAVAQVFDEVPEDDRTVRLPYVSLGPMSYDPELVDCIEGGEIMLQIDVWSNEPGQTQVAQVSGLVRKSLRGFAPVLSENALVDFNHWRTDHMIDGAVKHASIRYMGIVEESESS